MAVLWIAMLGVTASRGGCGGAWTRARPCASPPRRQSVRLLAADEQPQNDVARVKLDGVGRLGRRTTRIDFTCQACGSRTSRMINPEAYRTGVVIVQCASPPCSKHHVIADNLDYLERGFKNIVEWGKANGIPGILLRGAAQLPRSEVVVTEGEDTAIVTAAADEPGPPTSTAGGG